jgi:hypothetical protein
LNEISKLILRAEFRLIVFKSRVLRKIFVPKREEITVGWKKLHNQKNEWSMWQAFGEKSTYRILAGKTEPKRLLRKPRRRWKNILNAHAV